MTATITRSPRVTTPPPFENMVMLRSIAVALSPYMRSMLLDHLDTGQRPLRRQPGTGIECTCRKALSGYRLIRMVDAPRPKFTTITPKGREVAALVRGLEIDKLVEAEAV